MTSRKRPPSRKSLVIPVVSLIVATLGLLWLLAQPEPPPPVTAKLTPPRQLTPVAPQQAQPVAAPRRDWPLRPQLLGEGAEIAIVIDDAGIDNAATLRAIALPAQVTLAFLPYGHDVAALAARARAAGHELLVHMPMEPDRSSMNPGPNALLTGLPPDELKRRLDWNLSRFPGYIGVNNHMGSKFTTDSAAMTIVINELKSRGLVFLDSRTTAQTMGARLAAAEGEPFTQRDVFLDNDQSAGNVRDMLAKVELVAAKSGRAVAIGHPHPATLATLEQWLPTLHERGFKLVTISHVAAEPNVAR